MPIPARDPVREPLHAGCGSRIEALRKGGKVALECASDDVLSQIERRGDERRTREKTSAGRTPAQIPEQSSERARRTSRARAERARVDARAFDRGLASFSF